MTLRIVAAALKRGELIFSAPPPARHHTLMHEADRLFGDQHQPFLPGEQGFLASDGKFYGRKGAYYLAYDAGQLKAHKVGPKELFSEDLW